MLSPRGLFKLKEKGTEKTSRWKFKKEIQLRSRSPFLNSVGGTF